MLYILVNYPNDNLKLIRDTQRTRLRAFLIDELLSFGKLTCCSSVLYENFAIVLHCNYLIPGTIKVGPACIDDIHKYVKNYSYNSVFLMSKIHIQSMYIVF